MTGRNGLVLYKGPSVLNGEPIVVIATGLQTARRHATRGVNAKTGAMVQVYILAGGRDPVRAYRSGADAAVCGDCIHRQGSCYVRLDQGPLQVWRAYQRGRYRQVSAQVARAALAGLPVRLGAYGDPAAVPTAVWETVLGQAAMHTGYTHQWRTCDQTLAHWCMASCDTAEETAQARAAGWRTFTVVPAGADSGPDRAILCPASEQAGRLLHCVDCRACDGQASGRTAHVWIPVHGVRHKQARFEQLITIGGVGAIATTEYAIREGQQWKDGKGRTTITKEEIMLIEARAKLAAMVHATYQDNLTKGSDAWRAHQAAKRALDEFDLAHPGVVVELYEQFEAYQQAKVK